MLQHPSSIANYLRHGWKLVPIPFGSKGPITSNWNTEDKCLQSYNDLPPNWGVGLAHAYSGTMALDIDQWDHAEAELSKHNISLTDLYHHPDAVTIDSGKQGHGKLIYKMSFGLTLPSKKLITTENGQRLNYLDFRCSTSNGLTVQDVLPPSTHPETLQPYRWAGKGSWERLPTIPQPLIDFWMSLIEEDTHKDIVDKSIITSWSEIQTVLYHISPDCDREQWIHVGMALHHAGYQDKSLDTAFMLWEDWSSQSETKYKGTKDLMRSWRSFQPGNGITIGTLFHIAKEHGYERPRPSAEELFSAVPSDDKEDGRIVPVSYSDIIKGYSPISPSPDLSLFPEVLATRAKEVSDSIGCDPLVPLFAGLATAAGAANALSRLELMPGYKVPPILWLMTIGRPADKKTPGADPMMTILEQLEKEDTPRYKQALIDFEAQEIMYGATRKKFEEYYKSDEAILGEHGLPDAPTPPVRLKIKVQDITSQKLVRDAADRPEGLICHLDEMSNWIKIICDKRSGDNRSAWTVAYEAKRYLMDRVGAGSIIANNFSVSIFGNVQPRIFKAAMKDMGEDGLMQRFIPIMLDTSKTKRGNPVPDYMTTMSRWENAIRVIHALPETDYHLSHEAYKAFREFQSWYEDAKQDFVKLNFSEIFMTACGKLEGTTGRLIMVFHLLDNPFSTTVSKQTVDNVVQFIKNYVIPCYRYAYDHIVGDNEQDSMERWLFEWILYHCEWITEVSSTDLRRAARRKFPDEKASRFEKNELISTAMAALEYAKWVIRIEDYERKGVIKWAINPLIFPMFKQDRQEIVKKRQKWKNVICDTAGIPRQTVKGNNESSED